MTALRSIALLVFLVLVSIQPFTSPFVLRSVAAATCRADVAVIGADVSAGNVTEVQNALAVTPQTVQLAETLANEQAQAAGLIPPGLLGLVAVSSVSLRRLPPGSGLQITTSPAVTLDTAQTYANALLTAGMTAAQVRVTAPAGQPALGTTALLGLLRAAQAACWPVDAARRMLAIREVVLTSELAWQIGPAPAAQLLFALKNRAVSRHLTTVTVLAELVATERTTRGVSITDSAAWIALQARLVTFLHDLVSSGVYTPIVAAQPTSVATGPYAVVVRLHPSPSRIAAAGHAPASPLLGHHVPSASRAGTWRGTLVATDASHVVLRQAGQLRLVSVAPAAEIVIGNVRRSLGSLSAGELMTVTTNTAGAATYLAAAPPLAAASHVWHGTVARVSPTVVVIKQQRLAHPRSFVVSPKTRVSQNGNPSHLAAIRPGERMTVTTTVAGAPTRPDAATQKRAQAADSAAFFGISLGDVLLILAALVLIVVLLILLLIVARQRRRTQRRRLAHQRN